MNVDVFYCIFGQINAVLVSIKDTSIKTVCECEYNII